ncbi:MAG: hypothetical protein K2X86_11980 [Cytophagaceae bacterium]|nr:hypothetical protein [Cytophagaceae bacterium]
MMNARRIFAAAIIILITYFFMRVFGVRNYSLAHIMFALFILGSLIIAFATRKRDITMGILFGLIFVLFSLFGIFIFFPTVLEKI